MSTTTQPKNPTIAMMLGNEVVYPHSDFLRSIVADTQKKLLALYQLEQYVRFGVESFNGGSKVIQGWGISALIKEHFDAYVSLVDEIQGNDAAQAVLEKKEEYLSRSVQQG